MFSKELELSIASLFDKAHEANIQYITVEHLLLMISNDFDVKEFFKSQSVNIDNLRDDLNTHLSKNVVSKIDQQNLFSQHWAFKEYFRELYFIFNHLARELLSP